MKYPKSILIPSLLLGAVSCGQSEPNSGSTPPGPPGPPGPPDPPISSTEPNVILFLADDMGYGDVSGLNPDSKIRTRNLDAMCSNGIAFTDAHASSALSTPSRYSILTGRYPWRTALKSGVRNGYGNPLIAAERSTIADMFTGAGYATACIGKWHLGWNWNGGNSQGSADYTKPISRGPVDHGFQYFYGIAASLDMPPYIYLENNSVVQVPTVTMPARTGVELMREGPAGADFVPEAVLPTLLGKSLEYIVGRKGKEDPFFLYIPITGPHTPILPSKEFQGKSIIGVYGDFVLQIDDMIGQIVAKLKETDQYDNTIIMFTTDNGCASYIGVKNMEAMGHYPSYVYRGYKTDAFEGGHRIPLIVSWGDRLTARQDNSPVSLTDFYATFTDMTGSTLQDNEAEDSFSFWPVVESGGRGERQSIVATSGEGYFTYTKNYLKLIFWAGSGGDSSPTASQISGLPEMQLYDLLKDPGEKTNLINDPDYADEVSEMTADMRKILTDGRSTPGTAQSNDTSNDWKQTVLFR